MIGDWAPGQRLLASPSTGGSAWFRCERAGRSWLLTDARRGHKVQVLAPHVAELSQHMIEKVAARPVAASCSRRCRGC